MMVHADSNPLAARPGPLRGVAVALAVIVGGDPRLPPGARAGAAAAGAAPDPDQRPSPIVSETPPPDGGGQRPAA